jgi:predicted metal-dependent hydrolase
VKVGSRGTSSAAPGTVGSTTFEPARTSSTARSSSRPTRFRSRTAKSESQSEQLERGLGLIRQGEFFAAHEELEDAWRAAATGERDFFQGLVHFTVAWYQAGRGNRVGCERQLEKAARRLGPYAPEHRGVDVASILQQVTTATGTVRAGSLDLEPPVL